MPLPDAKPSTRIYELLKTTDLENITFSQFQSVAKTIFAEQGAEDELRRIVLLNLARLSVVGEWSGLTTAASGGGGTMSAGPPLVAAPDNATDQANQNFSVQGFLSQTAIETDQWNGTTTTEIRLIPCVAAKTGTLDQIAFRTGNTSGVDTFFAIYAANDDTNMPTGDPIATMTITNSTSNTNYNFTISASVERGKTYWLAYFGQTTRQRMQATFSGSNSVQAGTPGVPRYRGSIYFQNNHGALTVSGLTNGNFPTLTTSTVYDSTFIQHSPEHAVHIT